MKAEQKSSAAYWRELRGSLPALAKKHGTPLFIVSKTLLRQQVERFRRLLPRVEPFYAVKANSNPAIIKTLAEAGCGFDVASLPEIEWALAAGAKPDRLVFANTNKRTESIAYAHRHKVDLMTFDSEYELTKIAKDAPGASVLVRIKVPNVGSVVELSLKFGVEPADAVPLLTKAGRLGLRPAGVCFHVGSQCLHGDNYLEAFELAKIIISDARLKQLPLELVDIGGGFPIRHFDTDEDWFAHMSPALNLELNRLFDSGVRIIAEPGRALVGPACILLMSVIGKSIRSNKHWYYLDDGVYGALSGVIFDHCKYQFHAIKRGPTQLTTLAGPTCDSLDIIATAEELPELDFGDLVYAVNIGAYSLASATTFNGIPPAKAILVP
ncbi:type III PLP-dependent enzyme [candidate division WOR-3 bacterium]|nr:type III PLP-dependent enzyme [candidate division WOR-3 bacterium]